MKQILEDLLTGRSLSRLQTRHLFDRLADPDEDPVRKGAVLALLGSRGETGEELSGIVDGMIEAAESIPDLPKGIVDTCGTGGDMVGTVNISTAVAFVCAGAGLPVAKHGNRSISSQCGSADVLEQFGIPIGLGARGVADSLSRNNFAFLFAPHFHTAMKAIMPVRQALGIPTLFNLVGPLTNPAKPDFQLIGVRTRSLLRRLGQVVQLRGGRVLLVHGADGLDEATCHGPFLTVDSEDPDLVIRERSAGDFGLRSCRLEQLLGGSPEINTGIIRRLLDGEIGPVRDTVILNSALLIKLAGKAATDHEAVSIATDAIDSGRAAGVAAGAAKEGKR